MRVEVFVRPNAVKVGVGGSHDGALVVRVGEPADRGRATRATLRAVADAFGLPPSSVTLFRGPTTRRKVLEIIPGGTSEQLLQDRLRQLLQVHS